MYLKVLFGRARARLNWNTSFFNELAGMNTWREIESISIGKVLSCMHGTGCPKIIGWCSNTNIIHAYDDFTLWTQDITIINFQFLHYNNPILTVKSCCCSLFLSSVWTRVLRAIWRDVKGDVFYWDGKGETQREGVRKIDKKMGCFTGFQYKISRIV